MKMGLGWREVHRTLLLSEIQKDGERNLCFGEVKHLSPHGV